MRDDAFKDYVLDQLASLGAVCVRALLIWLILCRLAFLRFGGHGLYHGPEFIGILHQGRLYFRTDARNRPDYIARGMSPFQPNPRRTLASYYEVPADVLDDVDHLVSWAQAALSAHPDKRGK